MDTPRIIAAVALGCCLFFGLAAVYIFDVGWPNKDHQGTALTRCQRWSRRIYLFWLNFCGAAFGWGALLALAPRFWPCLSGSCEAKLEPMDVVLAVVAFLGVTGHLPKVLIGATNSVEKIATMLYSKWLGPGESPAAN